MTKGVAIGLLAGLVVLLIVIQSAKGSGQRRRRLKGRERLSAEDFGSRLSLESIPLESVRAARGQIADALDIEEGLLRPEDRFDGVLRPPKGWEYDDGMNILSEVLAKRAQAAGISLKIESVVDVDSYIREWHRSSERSTLPK